MEYEEENDGPGSVPDLGAIFMSNTETKMECFRQKILALPLSRANFVKKVKKGLVLFLFEFERRQLHGVYLAVSDGGMNISRSPFYFSGRHYPAQVRFTTMWECTPLCENDFREAIRENYFTPKKFSFGLSQVQVSNLLQLFDSRRPPPKQLGLDTRVTRSPGNDIIWADQHRISSRERLRTIDFEDDSPQMEMSEANGNMLFGHNRENTGKVINCHRENYLTDQVADSPCQRTRAYDADAGFHDPDAPALPYTTDDLDITQGKERVLTSCGFYPIPEVSEHGFNVGAGVGTKYSKASLDINRTDYERAEYESTNNQLFDRTMKSRLNSRGDFGCAISDELVDVHKSLGSRLGPHVDEDVNPMVPSKIYGTSGRSMHMMGSGMVSQHLNAGLGFDLASEKLQSFDISQRINEEWRFTSGSEVMNNNGIGGTHSSTISYNPSGYSGSHNREDAGNFISSDREADFPHSLNRFSTSYLDSGSFQLNGSQNVKGSNSAYHDSVVVTRTSAPECPNTYRHSSTGVNQGAGSDLRYYYGGGNLLNSSDRNLHEGEFCDRSDTSAYGENKDFHPARHHDHDYPYTVSQCPELRPSAPTLDFSFQFTPPSTAPFTDYGNFCPKRVSPLSSQNRTFSHGMESDIHGQEIDQRNYGDEVLPLITNSTGFGYHGEGSDHSKFHSKRTRNDDGGVQPDSQRKRRSVFSRMGQTLRARTNEENENDIYLHASVDEIMDMLNSRRSRDHRKSNHVVRQHGRNEMVRTGVKASPEPAKINLATTTVDASSIVIAKGVNNFPEETRGVGFKRRRNLKNMLAENNPKTTVLKNRKSDNAVSSSTGPMHDNTPKSTFLENASTENAVSDGQVRKNTSKTTVLENAVSEGPVHKQQRRRKLSRPNFGSGASVDAVGN